MQSGPAPTTTLRLDKWGYNTASGDPINTLSETLKATRLALSGGQSMLRWTNQNEDGVASYQIQKKDADGSWTTVDHFAPGAGSYSAKAAEGDYRLLAERVNGSTDSFAF